MKEVSWKSYIYVISIKKIIVIFLCLFISISLPFVLKNTDIALPSSGTLMLFLFFVLRLMSSRDDNMLQMFLYDKKKSRFRIMNNCLLVEYGKKRRLIDFGKIDHFSDISPFSISYVDSEGSGNYAESSDYKIYYLFINKVFFYTSILPIFVPPNDNKVVFRELSKKILFSQFKTTKDTKFCIWGCAFPFAMLVIIFFAYLLFST